MVHKRKKKKKIISTFSHNFEINNIVEPQGKAHQVATLQKRSVFQLKVICLANDILDNQNETIFIKIIKREKNQKIRYQINHCIKKIGLILLFLVNGKFI